MLALPIFPGRFQPSIVGRSELNFRVRDGNGWTLALISTNYLLQLLSQQQTINLSSDSFVSPKKLRFLRMVTRTGFEPMLKA